LVAAQPAISARESRDTAIRIFCFSGWVEVLLFVTVFYGSRKQTLKAKDRP